MLKTKFQNMILSINSQSLPNGSEEFITLNQQE